MPDQTKTIAELDAHFERFCRADVAEKTAQLEEARVALERSQAGLARVLDPTPFDFFQSESGRMYTTGELQMTPEEQDIVRHYQRQTEAFDDCLEFPGLIETAAEMAGWNDMVHEWSDALADLVSAKWGESKSKGFSLYKTGQEQAFVNRATALNAWAMSLLTGRRGWSGSLLGVVIER